MSSPVYQIEAQDCAPNPGFRTSVFRLEGENADLVALDVAIPIMDASVIEIDSSGNVKRIIWRV